MKIEIDLMEALMEAVMVEAERLGCDRDEVINSAVLRYFSEPFPSFDEEAARIARKLDEDLRQGFEELAQRLGLSREQVVEHILAAYLTDSPGHEAPVKVREPWWDPDQDHQ